MSHAVRKRQPNNVVVDEIHDNTSTQLVTITIDKLKLIQIEHLQKIEDSKSWHTPLSLVITLSLVFCSSQFKDAFGIKVDDIINYIKNKA